MPNRHAKQKDLFGPPAVPGLSFFDECLSAAEERALIARIDGLALAPFRFQEWLGKRLTLAFGWSYDFDHGALARAEPIPDWLLPLRDRAAGLTGQAPETLAQALLLRYDPGAGIGWHRDRPAFGTVMGVSLGAPAVLRFRRRSEEGFQRAALDLPPRSLYHLAGEIRRDWEHSIAPMAQTRWSITFRTLADPSNASARHEKAGSGEGSRARHAGD